MTPTTPAPDVDSSAKTDTRPFTCIVMATDFTEASARALDVAVELAMGLEASLVIAHCYEIPSTILVGMLSPPPVESGGASATAAGAGLEELLATTRRRYPNTSAKLLAGTLEDEVLALARAHGANLLVVGTHGRHGVARLILGSVAERLVRAATLPILVVPTLPE